MRNKLDKVFSRRRASGLAASTGIHLIRLHGWKREAQSVAAESHVMKSKSLGHLL